MIRDIADQLLDGLCVLLFVVASVVFLSSVDAPDEPARDGWHR